MAEKNSLFTLRQESGLSMQKLADKLGISVSNIHFYETGMTKPSEETLFKMLKIFFPIYTDYDLRNKMKLIQSDIDKHFVGSGKKAIKAAKKEAKKEIKKEAKKETKVEAKTETKIEANPIDGLLERVYGKVSIQDFMLIEQLMKK